MSRLGREDGFSLVAVLGVMVIAALLSVWALDAAAGDLQGSRTSQDRKAAYAAAESGLSYYRFRLANDNDVWKKCTAVDPVGTVPQAPINQRWAGTQPDPRIWRTVPDSEQSYTIELLPANGATACDPANPEATMIDRKSGTIRIRVTGRQRGVTRSIIGTFRRKSFLDFLYYTDFETLDPIATSDPVWSQANCARYRPSRPSGCTKIQFADFDRLNGPLHSNDSLLVCGAPVFGRTTDDHIETSQPAPGWYENGGCSGAPIFKGTFSSSTATMDMPPTNAALSSAAQPAYRYTGRTSIVLKGAVMDVTKSDGTTLTNVPLPPNGVIWISDGGCTVPDLPPPSAKYIESSGCATVYVHGTYGKDLTIASSKDIVVDGDLLGSADSVAGLIADNFVRVKHPVTGTCGSNVYPGTMDDVTIDAAIMSVQHSFIVDNYQCGARLNQLHVNGAIAQRFRGTVGTSGGGGTGYAKDYNYDDRLHYRNPPYFLDPVQAAWNLIRVSEQVPATK